MTEQPARFIFKLRQNIALEGDLALAQMELAAFLPGTLQPIPDCAALAQDHPQLAQLAGFGALAAHTRPAGIQAFAAEGLLALLPRLVRKTAFVQRIYCLTADTPVARDWLRRVVAMLQRGKDTRDARAWLHEVEDALGPVLIWHAEDGQLVIQALPHYALMELADVVARRAGNAAFPATVKHDLDTMLAALMGHTTDHRARQLAEKALAARSTTAHLSHDIHYYKAKFFPRLARAMLNICSQRLGGGPQRVIDNFSGSGTTLLEAATLGLPSVGLDIDPLSVLIAQAKLDALQLDSALLAEVANDTLHMLNHYTRQQLGLFDPPFDEQISATAIQFPAWLLKNRRMTPAIAATLGHEIGVLQAVVARSAAAAPRVQSLLRVLLSDAIARKIRMRFLGTGVGRFSLTFAKTPLHRLFARALTRYVNVAATAEWLRDTIHLQLAETQVRQADARQLPADLGQFDVLLTSPPYLPASSGRESYAKARAPSLIALGMYDKDNIGALAADSIGAMDGAGADLSALTDAERQLVEWLQQDELRAIKAKPTARYFLDMRQSFYEMQRVLRPGALAVMVSGKQSTFYNFATRQTLYVAATAELLAEEARRAGFEVEALHDVQLQKGNMNARPRSLDDYYETLIMLRKPE